MGFLSNKGMAICSGTATLVGIGNLALMKKRGASKSSKVFIALCTLGCAASAISRFIELRREAKADADMKDISQKDIDNSLRDIQKGLEQLDSINVINQEKTKELSEMANYTVQSAQ